MTKLTKSQQTAIEQQKRVFSRIYPDAVYTVRKPRNIDKVRLIAEKEPEMKNDYEMTDKKGFEVTTCGRCGGSGQYSFNLMHGSMCYGCQGTGKKYTKRGAAALYFFREYRKRDVTELKPGDVVYSNGWRTIVSISTQDERTRIIFKNSHALDTSSTSRLTIDGLFDEARDKALAFQDTLTKAGKPSKRKLAN